MRQRAFKVEGQALKQSTINTQKTMKQRQEFKVGDEVTFLSCSDSKRLPAKVIKVTRENDGERVFYDLSGKGVLSVSTGKSILESEHCCDQSTDYTGREFRSEEGEIWRCETDWQGRDKFWISARQGDFVRDFEISEIHRFEQ